LTGRALAGDLSALETTVGNKQDKIIDGGVTISKISRLQT
jgi:hypothetical protein